MQLAKIHIPAIGKKQVAAKLEEACVGEGVGFARLGGAAYLPPGLTGGAASAEAD